MSSPECEFPLRYPSFFLAFSFFNDPTLSVLTRLSPMQPEKNALPWLKWREVD